MYPFPPSPGFTCKKICVCLFVFTRRTRLQFLLRTLPVSVPDEVFLNIDEREHTDRNPAIEANMLTVTVTVNSKSSLSIYCGQSCGYLCDLAMSGGSGQCSIVLSLVGFMPPPSCDWFFSAVCL